MKKQLFFIATAIAVALASCSSDDNNGPKGGDNDEPDTPPVVGEGEKDMTDKYSMVVNGENLTLTQDLTRGGAICYISKNGEGYNIVNIADEGRYIQQSYYAGKNVNRIADGQGTYWSPWPWNPIQVGDYMRNRAKIVKATIKDNTTYVKCIPMLWDMNNEPAEAYMEQWTTVEGNVIHVKNKLTCFRTDNIYEENVKRDQEIPAVYPISSLHRLFTYNGSAPFTGDAVSELEVVQLSDNPNGGGGVWGRYSDISEKWMAFVNDQLWGLAIYSPSATTFAAGRANSDITGRCNDAATSYIAPLRRETLNKNSVMEYEYYLVVDELDNIRQHIYDIHSSL